MRGERGERGEHEEHGEHGECGEGGEGGVIWPPRHDDMNSYMYDTLDIINWAVSSRPMDRGLGISAKCW